MAATPAHEVARLFDCAVPGCREEAGGGGRALPTLHQGRPRRAREGAVHAGKLETGALALIGLARELDAELAGWHADVAAASAQLAKPR